MSASEQPSRHSPPVIVIGGGAAGFFGAIACAESAAGALDIRILERAGEVLGKVKISGGGRCNVTHDLDDPRSLAEYYPRGAKALIGPLNRWRQSDTVAWFAGRGVELKTEADGRMFPVTDRSDTVIDCLRNAAGELGVRIETGVAVRGVEAVAEGGYSVILEDGKCLPADAVLIATGGVRSAAARAATAGHELNPPVPSLFTFKIDDASLVELAGVSVPNAELSVSGIRLESSGPLLVTHWGLSGPAVLKLSAWGARELAQQDYRFELRVNWCGRACGEQELRSLFATQRTSHGARQVAKRAPIKSLPRRLWARLVARAGIAADAEWSSLRKSQVNGLCTLLRDERFTVDGKSLNKEEFVTCGGVRLTQVDFKTMQSRSHPGLYFAGEVLDIDGLTGGFNFQSAWTTGRIAGESIAAQLA